MSGMAPKGSSTGDHLAAHLLAGVAGGSAMIGFAMIQSARASGGFWYPVNIITAVLFPELRPVTGGFEADASVNGLAIHFYISAFWGLVFGALVDLIVDDESREGWELPLLGAGFGLALWFVMGLLIGRTLAPELALVRLLDFLFSHVLYGVVAALVMQRLSRRAPRS